MFQTDKFYFIGLNDREIAKLSGLITVNGGKICGSKNPLVITYPNDNYCTESVEDLGKKVKKKGTFLFTFNNHFVRIEEEHCYARRECFKRSSTDSYDLKEKSSHADGEIESSKNKSPKMAPAEITIIRRRIKKKESTSEQTSTIDKSPAVEESGNLAQQTCLERRKGFDEQEDIPLALGLQAPQNSKKIILDCDVSSRIDPRRLKRKEIKDQPVPRGSTNARIPAGLDKEFHRSNILDDVKKEAKDKDSEELYLEELVEVKKKERASERDGNILKKKKLRRKTRDPINGMMNSRNSNDKSSSICSSNEATSIISIDSDPSSEDKVARSSHHIEVRFENLSKKTEGHKRRQDVVARRRDYIPRSTRRNFSRWERREMVKYLIENDWISAAKGNLVWKQMIQDGFLRHRTFQSLNNHFRKFILPRISGFKMDERYLKKFQRLNKGQLS